MGKGIKAEVHKPSPARLVNPRGQTCSLVFMQALGLLTLWLYHLLPWLWSIACRQEALNLHITVDSWFISESRENTTFVTTSIADQDKFQAN